MPTQPTSGSPTAPPIPAPGANPKTFGHAALEALAKLAGFPSDQLDMAAAIAEAESGGDPLQTNTNSNGSVDRGLWQINSVHSQFNHALLLADPLYNARAAYSVWKSAGGNWSPWDSFTHNKYQPFLNGGSPVQTPTAAAEGSATNPVGSGGIVGEAGSTLVSGVQAVGTGVKAVVSAPLAALNLAEGVVSTLFSGATWFRVGKVLIGVVFGILGLVIIVKRTA